METLGYQIRFNNAQNSIYEDANQDLKDIQRRAREVKTFGLKIGAAVNLVVKNCHRIMRGIFVTWYENLYIFFCEIISSQEQPVEQSDLLPKGHCVFS